MGSPKSGFSAPHKREYPHARKLQHLKGVLRRVLYLDIARDGGHRDELKIV